MGTNGIVSSKLGHSIHEQAWRNGTVAVSQPDMWTELGLSESSPEREFSNLLQ
jgi:hypothetical protein